MNKLLIHELFDDIENDVTYIARLFIIFIKGLIIHAFFIFTNILILNCRELLLITSVTFFLT